MAFLNLLYDAILGGRTTGGGAGRRGGRKAKAGRKKATGGRAKGKRVVRARVRKAGGSKWKPPIGKNKNANTQASLTRWAGRLAKANKYGRSPKAVKAATTYALRNFTPNKSMAKVYAYGSRKLRQGIAQGGPRGWWTNLPND